MSTTTQLATITDAKRLIALSPAGARILGSGLTRPCPQARYNAAAAAALQDANAGYSLEQRQIIASFIEPESEDARTVMLHVRLSERERQELAKRAEAAGCSLSEFVRQRLFGA